MTESSPSMEISSCSSTHNIFLSPDIVDISNETLEVWRSHQVCDSITRFETLPSYEHIFKDYLLKNVPFILGSAATKEWQSRHDWVKCNGKPDLEFLLTNFGECVVPVANCQQEKYSAQPKTDMVMSEFIQYWESYMKAGYPQSMESLYLKDWHFTRDFPNYKAYATPVYFTSDWLNEFWDSRADEADDYRFVYMGPKGSWTPFHADVFRSYSWSANICGRKKWILFPPGQEENLKDNLGNLPYNVDSSEMLNCKKYPQFSKVKGRQLVIQEPGEIIYVPSGWHHQVHNLEDTISINHNWINGCNVDISWSFLLKNLEDVKAEIRDCLGMEGWGTQCQMILKASSGTDFTDFYSFILTIAENRLKALNEIETKSQSNRVGNQVKNYLCMTGPVHNRVDKPHQNHCTRSNEIKNFTGQMFHNQDDQKELQDTLTSSLTSQGDKCENKIISYASSSCHGNQVEKQDCAELTGDGRANSVIPSAGNIRPSTKSDCVDTKVCVDCATVSPLAGINSPSSISDWDIPKVCVDCATVLPFQSRSLSDAFYTDQFSCDTSSSSLVKEDGLTSNTSPLLSSNLTISLGEHNVITSPDSSNIISPESPNVITSSDSSNIISPECPNMIISPDSSNIISPESPNMIVSPDNENRMVSPDCSNPITTPGHPYCPSLSPGHIRFDFNRLIHILEIMIHHDDFNSLDFNDFETSPLLLLQKLKNI